ncbi:hypothetical protein Hanom_Chr02g00149221 [Helianthus anomalus]
MVPNIFLLNMFGFINLRVKCYFSSCGLSHFNSLVQMFHFSSMGLKRFHRCDVSSLG